MTNAQIRHSLLATARSAMGRARVMRAIESRLPDGATRDVVEQIAMRLEQVDEMARHEALVLSDERIDPPLEESAVHPEFARLLQMYAPTFGRKRA
jgi:hypothetical protein